jgi:hypothetical protein
LDGTVIRQKKTYLDYFGDQFMEVRKYFVTIVNFTPFAAKWNASLQQLGPSNIGGCGRR